MENLELLIEFRALYKHSFNTFLKSVKHSYMTKDRINIYSNLRALEVLIDKYGLTDEETKLFVRKNKMVLKTLNRYINIVPNAIEELDLYGAFPMTLSYEKLISLMAKKKGLKELN